MVVKTNMRNKMVPLNLLKFIWESVWPLLERKVRQDLSWYGLMVILFLFLVVLPVWILWENY